jgi:hypothetical protein
MGRNSKRMCFAFLVIFIFSLSTGTLSYAHDSNQPMNIEIEKPIIGTVPDNGYNDTPGGVLTEKELKELLRIQKQQEHIPNFASLKLNNPEITPEHFSLIGHSHYYDSTYNIYDGGIDRGEVASGYNGKNSKDTLTFTITRTVTNGWNCNIGFSSTIVEAGVGFSVTWSDTLSWQYSAEVNPYKTVHIGYQDWYHVKQYYCHTYWWALWPFDYNEYGSGWAQQWFKPYFYSWET